MMADEPGCTLHMTLLATFALLLARYSAQDDIVIGSPCADRPEAELESMIGLLVNTLALRVRIQPSQRFCDLRRSRTNPP